MSQLEKEWGKMAVGEQAEVASVHQKMDRLLRSMGNELAAFRLFLIRDVPEPFKGDLTKVSVEVGKGLDVLQTHLEAWKNQEGKPLQWGFDLSEMKPGGWARVLSKLGLAARPKPAGTGQYIFYYWQKHGLTIVTGNNPLVPREDSGGKDYVGYIGIEGEAGMVKEAVKAIKANAAYLGDESKGARDFI